ncbi:TonB-dependent receptor [Massilia sp. R2A-15]|uniref:TonB-dependent receptor n=1 Tax=Massilia sp. R2A-15 TaxID=3064278 RepID=UPI0027338E41|nr:TonB-dependent receptor [Massilia sp. R2A-15]WLI89981.1 TonB-dependent receptor [Massilia sp. R2A-15]
MLRKTVLVRALSVAFATAALTAAVTQPAMAQSNTVGIIFGTVPAGSANSVVLRNTDTNQTRTVQVDANGKFQASGLAIGHYRATLMKGNTAGATSEVDVIAGQGAEAIFPVSGVQSVQVQGRRTRIDVSNTNNGAVFTARELARLPIAPSVASIVQLAPNTTRGDPRYAAGDSFGGGGPSENAYYINGFPVTNPLTQLGASELPFGAIAQAQVLTGGYGAEFGRSVGGVVNITTKSGTNNWEVGAQYSVEPNAWRSKSKNYMYENTKALDAKGNLLNATTDGQVRVWRESNTKDVKRVGAYVGGPLIKDKLFMFLAGETTNTDTNFVNTAFTANPTTPAGWVESRAIQDRYTAKFDWNITDNHRLEFTKIGDDAKADRSSYDYNFATHQTNRVLSLRGNWSNDTSANGFTPSSGGDVQMLKYTGNITDDLTISALAGDSNVRHTNRFAGISTLLPGTAIGSNGNPNPAVPIPNPNPVTFNITPDGAADKVKAKRLDLEYKIATHTLRAGLDRVKMSSINAGQETPGGATWTYFKSAEALPTTPISMGSGSKVAPATGGQSGLNGFYVRKVQFSTSTSAASDQSAEYLEDKWQVTKNLLVTGGIRREGFTNRNGDNETFLKQDGNYSPRLSAAWDVNGDASFKVYGSAGRYFVQIPTNVTVRGASRATNTQQFYTYSGIDANGQPLGLVQLTAPRSSNNEFGQAKDPRTITATNLKPTYQDEVTLGFEKAFSPSLNFGVKGTYRKLRSTADDYCDQTPFDNWAARNGVSTANWKFGLGCVIMNPGEDQTFLVDFNNGDPAIKPTLTTVKLTAAEIGLPKTKRIYSALDFFAEHPLRDGWYGKVNYTLAKNHGNTEGQTNSDTAQANVSITAVWDFAQIMEYADGELPNSRKHQIKAFGFYQATPEWTVGGNFLAASGRPKGCLGIHPLQAVNDFGYGAAFHYCKQSLDASGPSLPAPRGTLGQYPWDVRLDMNLVYSPAVVNGLSLKLDVFNVTNRQTVQVLDDTRETSSGFIAARAGAVLSYTAARSARFTVEYNKKF